MGAITSQPMLRWSWWHFTLPDVVIKSISNSNGKLTPHAERKYIYLFTFLTHLPTISLSFLYIY